MHSKQQLGDYNSCINVISPASQISCLLSIVSLEIVSSRNQWSEDWQRSFRESQFERGKRVPKLGGGMSRCRTVSRGRTWPRKTGSDRKMLTAERSTWWHAMKQGVR